MNPRPHGRYADFQDPYEPAHAARPPNSAPGIPTQRSAAPPHSGDGGPYEYGPAPRRGGKLKRILISVLVILLVVAAGTYFWADSKLRKEVDLSKVIDRPAAGEGTNYLIVGSDSRKGMSAAQRKSLHTGGSAEAGQRTDSMMILHVGAAGPTLISLPRDSNVTIPQFRGSESGKIKPAMGANKLNASYAFDGPQLLVRTVEYNTGLHIDHYAEIGFTGFANMVDAMGGVEMDLDKGFQDKWSGADFKAGKQTLDGAQALAFVRTRHAFATSDLERTKNQQKFLSTLANQAASPATVLNPFELYPVMGAGLDTLVVDKDMNPYLLGKMFFAMKDVNSGEGKSMNMPVSGSVGGNLQWDRPKVKQLVDQLKNDDPVTVTGER
ncbi:LytR family transcriptional attenuator [Streptomyces sp. 2333.5]|uniref:LCP family protein n=1 Tax=unclassified Streptomyces TaxID=2593676 RepID=UPI0008990CEB|nr:MULTISPECIES: LCP family protein [unclassified Streptomyces]PJJ02977.1 LytR family transcriptional attenuator [Streptomyces sp. 2333.5]SED64932.1 transcriptional attenuator, LytR family [Streptomyces sp. 2314.4]SEE24317.1 transcriptional attenuator, LytR family [Streptomyces sp. 2112.2]